jgi:hypothetical protein
MFNILHISAEAAEAAEYLGSKEKFWYTDPILGRSLFKVARPDTGEDWSEKVAEQLARCLDLPCAQYELAESDGRRGVVTPTIVPGDASLKLGNELLVASISNYPLPGDVSNFRTSQHTISAVLTSINDSGAMLPPDWIPLNSIGSVCDLFLGYLMLDAWIGNTDRHHENWGIIDYSSAYPRMSSRRYLAPTFDHASSLGCLLLDTERTARLTTRDAGYTIAAYAAKARSALYLHQGDKRALAPIDAFRIAAQARPNAGRTWLQALHAVEAERVASVFENLPDNRITHPARDFALQLLSINRTRLLELRESLT